jgi:hypothetical protein
MFGMSQHLYILFGIADSRYRLEKPVVHFLESGRYVKLYR